MAFDTPEDNGGGNAPLAAPPPRAAIPASAGTTTDMPTGELQAPATPAPAQQLQLQPSQPVQPDQTSGSFFKKISHSFAGAIMGALAGPSQVVDGYDVDENGKQTPRMRDLRPRDRLQRIAQAALEGLAAGSQVPPQKSAGAAWGAGVGAGAVGEMRETQAQDLLKRQQSKEQFETEQKALTDKYIRAQHNITTYSLWQKGLQDQNEHDPERLKTEAIKNSAEDYISRNPATSMTTQVLSDTETRAMQAADKNNPASTTHVFFPYGMREVKDASGNTVYERDGVTPKREGQVLVIGGGSKDGKMPLPQTFVNDLKKYGAMAGIGRVDDVKAGDEWNLDRFLNAGSRMNPVKEKEIDGWKEAKFGDNAVKVGNQWMQENTFTHERRPYEGVPPGADLKEAEAFQKRAEGKKDINAAANASQKPVYAYNTQTKQTELTDRATMAATPGMYTNPRDVKQSDIEKDQQFNRQMADVQLNFSRYQTAKNALPTGSISPEHQGAATRILADEKMGGYVTNELTFQNYMNQINQGEKAASWNKLTPQEQEVLSGYLRAKASVVAYQKALSGVGKPNKEVMEIEMNNLPAPIVGKSASDTQFNAFQENLDTATQGYVKMPGSESPKEVRQRVESEAAKKAGATHVYDPGSGQPIPVGKTPVKNYKGQVLGYFLSGDSGEWVRFPKQ